jgi:hypothetical protein
MHKGVTSYQLGQFGTELLQYICDWHLVIFGTKFVFKIESLILTPLLN